MSKREQVNFYTASRMSSVWRALSIMTPMEQENRAGLSVAGYFDWLKSSGLRENR